MAGTTYSPGGIMTARIAGLLVLGTLVLAGCGRPDPALEDGLKTDLSLAAQTPAVPSQEITSPTEQGLASSPANLSRTRTPSRRHRPAYSDYTPRASASGGGYSQGGALPSGSAATYPGTPAPPPEPVRHTTRDAGIGAAAGAVLGAVSSRDKLKGAIIGAAAGGIVGGIIGQTVDIDHRP